MTMAAKLLLAICLSFLVSAAIGLRSPRLKDAQQCRLQRLSSTQPSQRIESDGGVIEMWNQNEEQFQCAGVAPLRIVLRPNTLHLPSFHPTPRLAYVVQGEGLLGVTIPGCPETFSSQKQQQGGQQEQEQQQQQGEQHQRIRRIRKGDVIAIPAGLAHWCANQDNQEDLVVITINDLNHLANQLDQRLRVFYLAGGNSKGGQQQQGMQNFFRAFDQNLLAEAYNVPVEIVSKMQREDERGFIVRVQEGQLGMIRPGKEEEEEEEQEQQGGQQRWPASNGLEENLCTMKLHANVDNREQADIYSRQAGKVTIVDRLKMPILKFMDMSLEKGNLFPNALITPHWSMNGHSIVYVTRGDAQLQVVNYHGTNVMNDRVNKGDMVVIPQFFAATIRAGNNGFEFVAVKTTGTPMRSPLAGYTSVMRAMPLEVISQAYQISPRQAQQLKRNRGGESILLSPSRGSS